MSREFAGFAYEEKPEESYNCTELECDSDWSVVFEISRGSWLTPRDVAVSTEHVERIRTGLCVTGMIGLSVFAILVVLVLGKLLWAAHRETDGWMTLVLGILVLSPLWAWVLGYLARDVREGVREWLK